MSHAKYLELSSYLLTVSITVLMKVGIIMQKEVKGKKEEGVEKENHFMMQ